MNREHHAELAHLVREHQETVQGLSQILRETIPDRRMRNDIETLVAAQNALVDTRISVLEERLVGHGRLLAAFGAALGMIAGALAAALGR